jgi:hypothetical protein
VRTGVSAQQGSCRAEDSSKSVSVVSSQSPSILEILFPVFPSSFSSPIKATTATVSEVSDQKQSTQAGSSTGRWQ